jgi:hypothetical protein
MSRLALFGRGVAATVLVKPREYFSAHAAQEALGTADRNPCLWHPVGFADLQAVLPIDQLVYLKGLVLIALPVLRVMDDLVKRSERLVNGKDRL